MPALKVTDENFEETIGNKDKPVLVKFEQNGAVHVRW